MSRATSWSLKRSPDAEVTRLEDGTVEVPCCIMRDAAPFATVSLRLTAVEAEALRKELCAPHAEGATR